MKLPYQSSLSRLKEAMFGGCEIQIIGRLLDDYMEIAPSNVLDIGSGDGEYISKIATFLPKIADAQLTCLEPNKRMTPLISSNNTQAKVISCDFNSYESKFRFDLMLSIHSIYYLGNIDSFLRKTCTLASKSSLLIVSLWSEHCGLYRLSSLLHPNQNILSAQSLEAELEYNRHDNATLIDRKDFVGSIDFSKIISLEDDELLGVISLISRSKYLTTEPIRTIRKHLEMLSQFNERINTVLTIDLKPL